MAGKRDDSSTQSPTIAELLAKRPPEHLQTLSLAMSEAISESQALMSDLLGYTSNGTPNPANDPMAASKALSKVGESLATQPDKVALANQELLKGWMELWQGMMTGALPEANRDRRFADPEWAGNPIFDFMRRSYELNANWLMSLIENADGLSEQDKRKAKYYGQMTVDAFAPTNFFASNPAALKAMLETDGRSVVEGLRQAREDLRKGEGRLMISQSDETPFEIGKNIATSPGKVVFRNDLIELIQYAPKRKKAYERPLLIFPPWINKFYILDLREENSMIRWLVDKGLTVFIVSWRSADDVTKDYGWDDYVENGIHAAVSAALEASGAEDLNAVGYCVGGTLLSGTLAHMAQTDDSSIVSATFFASQSDFEKAGDLLVFTDGHALESIEKIIEEHDGLMPGEYMSETFNWLRPIDLVWRYVVDNYMMGKKPRPFDLLYWNADQTNIPGPTHLTYLKRFYSENALSKGEFEILGRRVNLKDVKIPVFVQCSRDDHICPYDSVYNTALAFGGDTNFVMSGSGHIAGVVNPPQAEKYQHWVNPDLPTSVDFWMNDSDEIKGSWWPTWWDWLQPKSGEKIDAPKPKDKGLGDAPGTYVTRRLADIAKDRNKA